MKNYAIIICGVFNILDGILRICSLGFWVAPGFSQKSTFYFAKKAYFKR